MNDKFQSVKQKPANVEATAVILKNANDIMIMV